ncbi:MAG: VOC family protein [Gemmatimonadetes bacterium]|nr:VOC family protein [Gemmatimonadota bacterium]
MSVLERVDHLVVAAPDLEEGVRWFEERVRVAPGPGGRHPAWGTRNRILALGPRCYVEVIGPDPERESVELPTLFGIDRLEEPGLVAWAAAGTDLEGAVRRARAAGLALGEPVSGSRRRPDGSLLAWSMTDPYSADPEWPLPFLLDWSDSAHPAAGWTGDVTLVDLRAEHPEPQRLRDGLAVLDVPLPVTEGPRAALFATLRGPGGDVVLTRPGR